MKEHISKGDKEALNKIIQTYNIKSVFEIGTWEGATSLFFWNNPIVKRVKTIDIHKEMGIDYIHNIHKLQNKEFYGKYIKNTGVEFEFCDSMKYNPKDGEQYDMVFIDGNHNYNYVKNDTELAFKLNPKLIVWHDYNSEGNEDVLIFVTELQKQLKKIKVCDNSNIAFLEVRTNDKNS